MQATRQIEAIYPDVACGVVDFDAFDNLGGDGKFLGFAAEDVDEAIEDGRAMTAAAVAHRPAHCPGVGSGVVYFDGGHDRPPTAGKGVDAAVEGNSGGVFA